MFRGALFAGQLFAGQLFGAEALSVGVGSSSGIRRLTLYEVYEEELRLYKAQLTQQHVLAAQLETAQLFDKILVAPAAPSRQKTVVEIDIADDDPIPLILTALLH